MSGTTEQSKAREEAREHLAHAFFVDTDAELEGMRRMAIALQEMNPESWSRVLRYFHSWTTERIRDCCLVVQAFDGICIGLNYRKGR